MPQSATRSDFDQRLFRRAWFRLVIPLLFAAVMFGIALHQRPEQFAYALGGFGIVTCFCLLLHGGVLVSTSGIAWYVLTPRWRYRVVPWDAVRGLSRCRWGQRKILLDVQPGRYEPWVWGSPQPDRPMTILLDTRNLAEGDAVWPTLQAFYAAQQRAMPHKVQPIETL